MKTKKLEKFINLLQDVLIEADEESKKANSAWIRLSRLSDVVIVEIQELLEHAKNGEIFFKYGKKQRRLGSAYLISEDHEELGNTLLATKIYSLQEVYNKL